MDTAEANVNVVHIPELVNRPTKSFSNLAFSIYLKLPEARHSSNACAGQYQQRPQALEQC
jgi:hypothetical protein